ncbi:unnamed protein product, partial [Discosporangium mesarthrocarpum]
EPHTYRDVLNSEYRNLWFEAMERELTGLQSANVFSLAELPPGRKAVGAKWVFKWKTDEMGKALSMEFPTNNLGALSWYTGCAFERDWEKGTLTITQTAYIDQLCERFDVSSPSPLPATAHEQTLPRQKNDQPGPECFRELIGSLLWLANMTRPDVSNAVRALARYSHDPSGQHWTGALRIL